MEHGGSLAGCTTGHFSFGENPAGHVVHDIEHLSQNRFVFTQGTCLGYGYIGTRQCGNDTVFTIDSMCRWQQCAGWFLTQDVGA